MIESRELSRKFGIQVASVALHFIAKLFWIVLNLDSDWVN